MRIFDEKISGFRAKFQKRVTCVAFSIKFAKTNQKFAENSEFCEKISLLLVNYSLLSLGAREGGPRGPGGAGAGGARAGEGGAGQGEGSASARLKLN